MRLKLWSTALLAALGAQIGAAAELPTGNGWHAIPNTALRTVCAAENGFPQVWGAIGCDGITAAWSGGVFDSKRNRMIIFGGGHNDYYGNEIYAFSLDTLKVERLTDPGLPVATSCTPGIVNNSQPNSRHTYDGIEYIAHLDKMFVFGGSLACGAGNFGSDTWTFDFATNKWQRMNPTGTLPVGDAGMVTAYDPVTKLIYLHDRRYLYTYDAATDRYTRLGTEQAGFGYHMAATIDPVRRRFVVAGYDSTQGAGRVHVYDIGPNSTYSRQTLSTTGGSAVVGAAYPGLEFDPVSERIVGWVNRDSVYLLDLSNATWTARTYSSGPTSVSNGVHSRWRYSPAAGVFVSVNDVDANIHILRMSGVTAPRPNAPTSVTVQ